MITRRLFTAIAAAAFVAVAAPGSAEADSRTSVVATTSMIADAARQVGGDRVDVAALMGPGVDPHAYRQTRSDIAAMLRADLVLWHGLYLEAQMEDFLLELGERKTVVAVGEAVPVDQLRSHADYQGRFDPHVWMDPQLWRHVIGGVQAALTRIDPDGADVYAANAERHLADVENLSVYAADTLASVPESQRVLLTAHDAFSYFGDAYGFEVLGVQGISTESEAGVRDIEQMEFNCRAQDFRDLRRKLGFRPQHARADRRRRSARLEGHDRRRALFRRDGRSRNLRGDLYRYDRS